jgi:hypothetical protein
MSINLMWPTIAVVGPLRKSRDAIWILGYISTSGTTTPVKCD